MPTDQILVLLIQERDKLNHAIEVLRGTKRRGRPPRSIAAVSSNGATPTMPAVKKSSRKFTAAQRKQQAERMKAYWAKKRKQTAK